MASEYWKKWYAENRDHFMNLVKHHTKNRRKELQSIIDERKNGPCLKCNNKYPPVVMNFIHRGDKLFRISDATKKIYSKSRLLEELDKCDMYCTNCLRTIEFEKIMENPLSEQRDRRRRKLKQIIDQIKDKECLDCNKVYPPYCMDFDHLDGSKKVDSISSLVMKELGMKEIIDELDKTELVCANCHRLRTHSRKNND